MRPLGHKRGRVLVGVPVVPVTARSRTIVARGGSAYHDPNSGSGVDWITLRVKWQPWGTWLDAFMRRYFP